MTDNEIMLLMNMPKVLSRKEAKKLSALNFKEENAHWRTSASLEADSEYSFQINVRQSMDDAADFSAILTVVTPDGMRFNLTRCNGASHSHRNKLERTRISGVHRHIATERYINFGGDAEGFAVSANGDYNTLDEAIDYLLTIAHIDTQLCEDNETSLFDV